MIDTIQYITNGTDNEQELAEEIEKLQSRIENLEARLHELENVKDYIELIGDNLRSIVSLAEEANDFAGIAEDICNEV